MGKKVLCRRASYSDLVILLAHMLLSYNSRKKKKRVPPFLIMTRQLGTLRLCGYKRSILERNLGNNAARGTASVDILLCLLARLHVVDQLLPISPICLGQPTMKKEFLCHVSGEAVKLLTG